MDKPFVIGRTFRFLSDSPPQRRTRFNTTAILDFNNPLTSRLRIPDDAGYATATVRCAILNSNKSAVYRRNSYGMLTT